MPTALNIFNFKLFIQYEHRTHTQCTHEPNEEEEEEHEEANNERETKKIGSIYFRKQTHTFSYAHVLAAYVLRLLWVCVNGNAENKIVRNCVHTQTHSHSLTILFRDTQAKVEK